MELLCDWCEGNADIGSSTVYWELPDGTRAIEIIDTPAVICGECKMIYQRENIIKLIEEQLFLVDTKRIGKSLTFEELMALPRLLKRNYFDFSDM